MDQAALSRTRSRGISFRSDKSGGSKGKVDLTESPEEKSRRDSIWKNSSKANPNAALNELTPGGKLHHRIIHPSCRFTYSPHLSHLPHLLLPRTTEHHGSSRGRRNAQSCLG